MIEPKNLPGFMELLPNDQILFNNLVDIIRKNFEKYGFLPLDTPVLESSDVLLAKAGGETEKQIYRFNKGENDICMRFDLTVPLAKYVASNLNELNFPFSRYQIGKVYRGEKPQKGRFREFYQCDIDIIGKETLNLAYDAEIPSIMYNIFKNLNLGDFVIKLSNRKLLLGLFESLNLQDKSVDILRMIDKFAKIGEDKFVLALKEDFMLSCEQVDKILAFIKITGDNQSQIKQLENLGIANQVFELGVKELSEVVKLMADFGMEQKNYNIDLSIARGLDYYTGTVYETFLVGHENLGSICSGGRYENLAGFYTKTNLPGVGMSIGLTRLFYQLKQNQLLKAEQENVAKVIILPMGDTKSECIKISNVLRENNINCLLYLEDTKFKNKMAYASKSGIKFAVLVGEDEANGGYVTLKNLTEFSQQQLPLAQAVEILKN